MDKKNLFDNPIAIVILLFSVGFTNIILSVQFISILLAGVVFIAFIHAVKHKHYYLLFTTIFAFTIIETSQGLKIFNLLILSWFVYIFILPKVNRLFRSAILSTMMILFLFYLGVFGLFLFLGDFHMPLVYTLLQNYILDFIIVSLIV